jgi:hypothetical protein
MKQVQITPNRTVKLTAKQSKTLRNLDNFGPLFVSHRDSDKRTFDALVEKGVAKVVSEDGYGVNYQIVKVQA